jgi:hypothetical protein
VAKRICHDIRRMKSLSELPSGTADKGRALIREIINRFPKGK